MILYLLMLAVSVFFSVFAQRVKSISGLETTYHIFAVLSFLPFALVTCLRWRVGTDWDYVYEPYYYMVNHGIDEFSEQGFNLLYRAFGLFTDDSWWVISFIGLLTLLLFFLSIYHNSCMIPFTILLFFLTEKYFMTLNQIRQMLAMAVFAFSYQYIPKRQWKPYFLINLIGFTFHTSSLLYLPIYFLYEIKITAKRCVFAGVIAILLLPVLRVLLPALVTATRYGWYLEDANYNQNNFYLIGFAVSVFFTLVHVFFLYRYPDTDQEMCFMTLLMLVSTLLLLFTTSMSQILRVSEGLSIVQIFSLPRMIQEEKDRRMRVVTLAAIIAIFGVKLFYDIYVNKWYGAIPYQTVFSR